MQRRSSRSFALPPPSTCPVARPGPRAPRARRRLPLETNDRQTTPALLSGGNPQIAKGDGDAPVQAYIAAMPGWKRELGERLDALIAREVPGVRSAPCAGTRRSMASKVKILSFHVFTRYVKVTFFGGAALQPVPPGRGKDETVRWLDIHEGAYDEEQMASWVRQAAQLPGWGKV